MQPIDPEQLSVLLDQAQQVALEREQLLAHHARLDDQEEQLITELWEMIAGWQPVPGEKAASISLDRKMAVYVWYVETEGDRLSFKEFPDPEGSFKRRLVQSQIPRPGANEVIVPLSVFKRIQARLHLRIMNP
jgi:hypothetical protein